MVGAFFYGGKFAFSSRRKSHERVLLVLLVFFFQPWSALSVVACFFCFNEISSVMFSDSKLCGVYSFHRAGSGGCGRFTSHLPLQ